MDATRLRDVEDRPLDLLEEGAERDLAIDAPMVAPRLCVERVAFAAMAARQTAWADLCARTLEPNVFLEPGFALPLVQHMPGGKRPSFLLIWEENGTTSFGRLVGLLPLAPRRHVADRVQRGLADPQVCLGVPLLDRAHAALAWAAALDWLAGQAGKAALSLRFVPREGAFFRLLLAPELGPRCRLLDESRRACLQAAAPRRPGAVACFGSAKRRKEMRRLRRRLADRGARSYVSARTPAEIRRAAERFLALEHAGWKGERGTSLLADPRLATFARSMTRLLAHEGKCRIDALEVDGRPVAMAIVVTAGGVAHFWKTAFDETYAPLSPGVQLALELTETQLADAGVTMTDSCALPDHPMIDRLWPDRMALADVLIDLRHDEPGRFARVYAVERLRGAARQAAKVLVHRLRRLAARDAAARDAPARDAASREQAV